MDHSLPPTGRPPSPGGGVLPRGDVAGGRPVPAQRSSLLAALLEGWLEYERRNGGRGSHASTPLPVA